MKTLYELGKINLKQIKVIESLIPMDSESPLRKLNAIVLDQNNLDDYAAMVEVYGRKNLAAFSRLKTRLKDILLRATLLQGISTDSDESRVNVNYNLFRHSIVTKLLIDLKANSLSIEIAEKAILKAIKYYATENVILFVRILVRHFGSIEHNKYKLNKYLAIQEKYLKIQEWEIKAENYYYDLQRTQLQSLASPSDSTKERAFRYVQELEGVKGIRSYYFNLNKYKVKAAHYEYQKNYDALLKLSDLTLKEFSTPDFRSPIILQNVNIRKSWALIQSGRNDETIAIGVKEMNRLPPGSLGWYFIAHYTLKAYLYKGDIINSIEVIKLMVENPKFLKIGKNYQELFYTTLGYVHLIVDSGIIKYSNSLNIVLPEFKLYKFLNTIPIFSKDKRGINVSILLMHVAYLLQRKDYNAIIDRVDSLNQYAYRYLRKDDSFRSNCMIKMVIQMTRADFNPIRTERYTHDLLEQLKEVKLAGSGENIETEIIPYELLWQIMTKSL